VKRQAEILEHGWTRKPFIPPGITEAQAKEQIEYDRAVQDAVRVMDRLARPKEST